MSAREDAERFDRLDRPVQASRMYEVAIAGGGADTSTYIDAAVLYFVCQDPGYASGHRLVPVFVEAAWRRMFEILDDAEHRFGEHPEVAFWRRYFRYILMGEDEFCDYCEELLRDNRSLVPCFFLVGSFCNRCDEPIYQKALELYESVRAGRTARERYIKSVLETVLRAGKY